MKKHPVRNDKKKKHDHGPEIYYGLRYNFYNIIEEDYIPAPIKLEYNSKHNKKPSIFIKQPISKSGFKRGQRRIVYV